METRGDFLQLLGPDLSTNILSLLDDPADIIRATSVSHPWHKFVVENGFSKRLCLKLFPEVSSAVHAIEVDGVLLPMKVSSSGVKMLDSEKNHKVYAILARGLSPIPRNDCILRAIGASSTDNYPIERIEDTLEPDDRIGLNASYWSSKGESDDGVPETLMYKLISDLCFVTEINIRPFQAFFEHGLPIYSAKAVRFRMSPPKLSPDDCIEWTYESPVFPMTQENCLQTFKLPEPVLCIGGTLLIELLGRTQRNQYDDLFYICVSHVQVVGRTLLPAFDAIINPSPGVCVELLP